MSIPTQVSITILLGLLSLSDHLLAQQVQLPLFAQYRENQAILNPAALNIDFIRNDYNLSAGISYRSQWGQADLILDNGKSEHFGPRTMTARVEWIFPDNRFFLGTYLMSDDAAALNLLGGYIRAGYFILDPEVSSVALAGAIGLGFNRFKSDLIDLRKYDYATQYTDISFEEDFNIPYWDVTLGIFGWGEVQSGGLEGDIIYAGVSLPQYQGVPLEQLNATRDENRQDQEDYVQINVVAGIYKFLAEETFIEGSLNFTHLLKARAPKIITPNFRWHFKDIAWFGAGARLPLNRKETIDGEGFGSLVDDVRSTPYYTATSILIDVGFNIGKNLAYGMENKNLKLGLGYEIPVGRLLRQLGNTIEINLTYTLDTGGGRR